MWYFLNTHLNFQRVFAWANFYSSVSTRGKYSLTFEFFKNFYTFSVDTFISFQRRIITFSLQSSLLCYLFILFIFLFFVFFILYHSCWQNSFSSFECFSFYLYFFQYLKKKIVYYFFCSFSLFVFNIADVTSKKGNEILSNEKSGQSPIWNKFHCHLPISSWSEQLFEWLYYFILPWQLFELNL